MNSILSMTGFAQASTPAGIFTLKSHNHRFLELHLSLPSALGPLEMDLRTMLGAGIHRGKVYFSIAARPDDPIFRPRLNAAWIRELHAQWTALFPGSPDLPGSLLQPETAFLPPDVPEETWSEGVRAGAREVLEAFRRSRAEEGRKIVPSMLDALGEISAILAQVGPRLEGLRGELTARLRGQMADLLEDRKPDPDRLEQEAAVLCARMDPEEELVRAGQFADRIREHLEDPPVPAGKMLDFLVQELGRELQTLSQKVRDLALREDTVRLKMLCERLREQVQNIE
jgi:uncharacterized protein YicC (UPF0701 family)